MKIPVTRILAAILSVTFAMRSQYMHAIGMMVVCGIIAFLHMLAEDAIKTRAQRSKGFDPKIGSLRQ